jgi:hypothetical protein
LQPQCAGCIGQAHCNQLFADLVADDATDSGAANGSERTATGQNRTANSTNAGTDSGTLVLRRHAGTTCHAEQQNGRRRA